MRSKRIYLDYASLAPLREGAKKAMHYAVENYSGDPARIYFEGAIQRDYIEQARAEIALLGNVQERELIFTSSVTEAVSLAVFSILIKNASGPILISQAEHSSVKKASENFAKIFNVEVQRIGIDSKGVIKIDQLENQLLTLAKQGRSPSLVAVQWANQEVGTIQPLDTIIDLAKKYEVKTLVDAAQAFGLIPTDFKRLGADYVAVSSAKMGGPSGIAGLILGNGSKVSPLFYGEQERARRGGLENFIGIAGFSGACEELLEPSALQNLADKNLHLTRKIHDGLLDLEGIDFYGDLEARVPHILSFGINDVEAEACLIALDQKGIAIHSGSACSSESLEPSEVLEAMGISQTRPLRVSVGFNTTEEEISVFLEEFFEVVSSLRALARRF